jgi:hypothetical protein
MISCGESVRLVALPQTGVVSLVTIALLGRILARLLVAAIGLFIAFGDTFVITLDLMIRGLRDR